MTFTFTAEVAWDPNGRQNVKNVSFQVFAVADTGFTTPLPITDTFGVPLPGNILNSGNQGTFPSFQQATNPVVVLADSTRTYAWTLNCVPSDAAVAAFINTAGSGSALAVKSEVTTGATRSALDGIYAHVVQPETYGAIGDGAADDTAAINSAIATLTPGATLLLRGGKTYTHSNTLTIPTNGVTITGGGVLKGTAPTTMTLILSGTGQTVDGVKLLGSPVTRTGADKGSASLYLDHADRTTVRNVTTDGASTVGIFVDGATNFIIDRADVKNTKADGIHITNGSTNGLCTDTRASNTGDDGFAVVSYAADATYCSKIVCEGFRLTSQNGGRGMTVVGGQEIRYRDFYIESSYAAALYIAAESGYSTRSVSDVICSNGTIVNANTNTIDHGAILLAVDGLSTARSIQTVTIEDISVRDTRAGASRSISALISNGGTFANIKIRGIRLLGTMGQYVYGFQASDAGSYINDIQMPPSTTAARLGGAFAGIGCWYFDTTLMRPLYWFTGNVWQDGGGTAR